MKLDEYPDAIAAAEVACLEAQGIALELAEKVEATGAQFKAIVATDPELKNDAQRKAALAELQGSDPDFLALVKRQRVTNETLELGRIEVRRLERCYEVALGYPSSLSRQQKNP